MKDLSQEGQRKRSLMSETKVAVPEPVSPGGSTLGTCADFPTTPHQKGTCENCDMWTPLPFAPEAAAEDVPKSYNDFLRKYYPATAEKLIAESAASPVAGVSARMAEIESRLAAEMRKYPISLLAYDAAYLLRLVTGELAQPSAEGDGWIAVTERLPQTGAACWVVYDGVVQHIAYCREGLGFACVDGYEWRPADEIVCDPIHDSEVTHWRPLPTPPSVQEEKGSRE